MPPSVRVHVALHAHKTRHATTRQAAETDSAAIPQIAFPDNDSFVASDIDFAGLFPASLPRFAALTRFACIRCQLARVPPTLFALAGLTDVNLSGNAIHDMPVQLERSRISTLDFAKNEFTDVPVEVFAMPQLRALDLSANRVTACATPASSGEKTAAGLESLTLDDNPLAVFTCRFPNLRRLSLYNTSLTSLPRVLSDLVNLTQLNVGGNPSLVLTPNNTQTLSTLTELDLSSNGLEAVPPILRTLAPKLTTLRLTRSNLSDDETVLAAILALPNLTTLILDDNKLKNATAIVARFPALTNLSVAHNAIAELSSSNSFDSLRFLNASGNAIKSFALTAPRLETLDLSNNSLSSVSAAIFGLYSLQELYLCGNPIEPLALSTAQFTFLSGLKTLAMDQTAFASCAVENQRSLHGKLQVCVSSSQTAGSSAPSPSASAAPPSPATSGSRGRTSTTDQMLYLGGSFLIAILIALWIYTVKRRRAAREAAMANQGSSSVSFGHSLSALRANSSSQARRSDRSQFIRSHSHSTPSEGNNFAAGDQYSLSVQSLAHEAASQTFWEDEELQAWRVEFNDVKTHARVAVGVFTEVWRASYRTDTVAVKKLKSSIRLLHLHHPEMVETGVLDEFIAEIRVLSRLNHPRIVAFYGAAWTTESELTAVMEFMPQQDLRGFLNQRIRHRHSTGSHGSEPSSSWTVELLHIALCVAEALTYLHAQEPPLVHGNVQAKNVLLDGHMDSKLCDFGSAQYCAVPLLSFSDRCLTNESDEASSSFSLASVRADATPWIPPEVLRSQAVCDPSIDIYAFGVLLSEIDTNRAPYDDGDAAALNDLEIRHRVAIGSLRPGFSMTCPLSILALATKCLAFEPSDRPTSTDLTFALREILGETERQTVRASVSTQETRASMGQLLNLPSNDSDSDMSQRTIEFRRYSST